MVAGRLAPGARRQGRARSRCATSTRPSCPGPGWVRVRPRLAGICGSRPRHHRRHVVALLRADRVVPVRARPRGRRRPRRRHAGSCRARPQLRRPRHRPAVRRRAPTGASTAASASPSATSSPACRPASASRHRRRLVDAAGRPRASSHARARRPDRRGRGAWSSRPPARCTPPGRVRRRATVAVIGAGHARPAHHRRAPRAARARRALIATAKHPEQRRLATRARRRRGRRARRARPRRPRAPPARCVLDDGQLTGGADAVVDCVGSRRRRSPQALRVVAPGGTVARRRHARRDHRRPHRRCGTARSRSGAATPTRATTSTTALDARRATLDLGRLVTATYPLAATRTPSRHAADAGRRGAVKIAFDLRAERERDARLMPRPGFVLEVDRSTPPILFHHGEGFRLEKLPAGRSRVIYPAEPLAAARATPTPPSATRCDNPLGDSEPLPALLRAGHEAHDRLRRHLAAAAADAPARHPPAGHRGRARPGRRGRRRRRPPHRRPRPAPAHDRGRAAPRRRRPRLRRLRPARPALQPRRRGPRQPRLPRRPPTRARRSRSTSGRPRATCSSTSTSTSSSMDGGWKSTATGLASLPHRCATTTTCTTMQHSRSRSWTSTRSELHSSNWRMGEVLARRRRQGLPDRDHAQQRHVRHDGPDVGPAEARVGVDGAATGPRSSAMQGRARPHAGRRPAARSSTSWQAPYGMTSVQAGEVEAVHEVTTAERLRAAARAGRGPDRHPHDGAALHLPLQRQLDHEPDPRDVPRARLLLQPVPGQAAGARGRRADHEPPDAVGVPPRAPPELHRLLRAGAGRDHRPGRDRGSATRSSSPRTSGTATCTARATPTTASTRSTCGTGARTRCSTSAG